MLLSAANCSVLNFALLSLLRSLNRNDLCNVSIIGTAIVFLFLVSYYSNKMLQSDVSVTRALKILSFFVVFSKIMENLNSVSGNNNIISSDCSCQTEADISKSCLCRCNDFCCDIKELKASQNASKEAIQALSGTVDLIAETFAHFQENIHVKTNQEGRFHVGKKRSLHESRQEFDMQESFNEHNSIETIRIIEATNCASPKVNNTPSQINTNLDSHLNNEVESIEIIEASTSTDPKVRHVATKQSNINSIAQSKSSATESKHSTQKHLVPCPYLRKKGHCLKGSRCDFSTSLTLNRLLNPTNPTMQPYNAQPLCKDKMPSYPLPGFPPIMNLPTFQFYMNYPIVYIPPSTGPPPIQQNSTSSNELPCSVPSTTNGNLYKTPPILRCEEQRIPVRITNSRRPTICQPFRSTNHLTSVNFNNLTKVPLADLQPRKSEFVPSLTLTNTMSLAPKIDEVICFIEDNKTDFVCITETWLTDLVSINYLQIPTYNLICKNRSSGAHGGVWHYIKNFIKYDILEELHVPDYEVLWVRISPTRLPRGFSSIVIGTVYHPPSANTKSMLEYLFKSLKEIESQYPNCRLLLAGDFNRLDVKSLVRHFKRKQ